MGKLLIADDSAPLLEALKYILERNGYEVKALPNAHNIQREINEFEPDLLIIDIFLGDEDGREVCKKVRNTYKNKDLSILVFSAFPKCLENYLTYGADDCIEKPFELKNLMDKIKAVLRRQLVPAAL